MINTINFVFNNRIYQLLCEDNVLKILSKTEEPIFCGSALVLEKSGLPIARLALQVYRYSLVDKH